MLDLKKLNDMLDSVLETETSESLNGWIDRQIEAERPREYFSLTTVQKSSPAVRLPLVNFFEFSHKARIQD